MTVLTKIDTPLGAMIASSDGALTGLWFEGQKYGVCLCGESKMG